MASSVRALILGGTGMVGHSLFRLFSDNQRFDTFATVRDKSLTNKHFNDQADKFLTGLDALNPATIRPILQKIGPDVVINCIGIIKQLPEANDPVKSISVNSLFPHIAARECGESGARFIQISTDCVFSGKKGNYAENDFPDAEDFYGRTKYLGEITQGKAVTLRTSIIGHELKGRYGLVEWFLSQNRPVRGFANAIFTGFTSVELARILSDYVIPNENLAGLYQISSEPLNKYELLKLIASVYSVSTEIIPDTDFKCDRSLDSTRFRKATGYVPPAWPEMIQAMRDYYLSAKI